MLLYLRTMEATDIYVRGVSGLRKVKKRSKVVLWAALAFAAQEREGGHTIEAEH